MKDRPWLSQLIIQPIMIVLSILAALAVNNWQESRAAAKRVAEARAAFANEIASNKQLLLADFHLPHHRLLRVEYDKALKENLNDPGTFFDGLHRAPLRDSAWRMLSGTATLMKLDPEFVLALTDIYQLQDSIQKRSEAFLTGLGAPRSDRDSPAYTKDLIRSISFFLNDLVPEEEKLLKSYGQALARFATDKPLWVEGHEKPKD